MSTDASDATEADNVGDEEATGAVAPNVDGEKVGRWYADSMPHVAPATDGPNKDTIWFEVLENEELAKAVAESMSYPDAEDMDTVVHVIRDDFREFFFPLDSNYGGFESNLEYLKDHHLSDATKYNEELDYDHEVKNLDIGGGGSSDSDDSKTVDFNSLMDEGNSDDEEVAEMTLDEEIDDVFSDI